MSNKYRTADCQSTKNVMGDKGVDPQSGPSGTSLGFSTTKDMSYLGHFKGEKVLRDGHNFGAQPSTVMPRSGVMPRRKAQLAGSVIDTASRGLARRAIATGGDAAAAVAAERPVIAARMAAKAAGVTGADRRSMVQAARMDPNSARSERRARRY